MYKYTKLLIAYVYTAVLNCLLGSIIPNSYLKISKNWSSNLFAMKVTKRSNYICLKSGLFISI